MHKLNIDQKKTKILDHLRSLKESEYLINEDMRKHNQGTNIIVTEKELDGIVLKMSNGFSKISKISKNIIYAQAGCTMKNLAIFAGLQGHTGYEFMYDIPGSVGGGVYMNAGNAEGKMENVVTKVRFLTETLDIIEMEKNDLKFEYRNSIFKDKTYIVLGAYFLSLNKKAPEVIKGKMEAIKNARWKKFPMEYPNAGSVFKRPQGYFAGKLIKEAGCAGLRLGDAQVSSKHTGFIVNLDKATSQDIIDLIKTVQNKVMKKFGVLLEPEQVILS